MKTWNFGTWNLELVTRNPEPGTRNQQNLIFAKNITMGFGIILGILSYLLPAIVLFFAVWLVTITFMKNQKMKREAEKQAAYRETLLPLKLQASERLILLLERITPSRAVNRALEPGMSAFTFQMGLLKNIREEYEHNVAQQLYVSSSCWSLIRAAKEEVIRQVNIAAAENGASAGAAEMAALLIENWSALAPDPIQAAIDQVKQEINFKF